MEHPLAQSNTVDLRALQGLPLLLREPGSTTRAAMEKALAAAGVKPQLNLEIGSREIREAVAGPGHRRGFRGRIHSRSALQTHSYQGEPASTTTYVYCMQERSDSLLVRSFRDAIQERE